MNSFRCHEGILPKISQQPKIGRQSKNDKPPCQSNAKHLFYVQYFQGKQKQKEVEYGADNS